MKNARSPIPSSRVKTGICGPHQDIRRHVSSEEGKALVLTKAQQVIMDLWVRDDAKNLLTSCTISWALDRTKALTNSGVPMGTPTQVMTVTLIMSSSGLAGVSVG